jgi:hypothetical protein
MFKDMFSNIHLHSTDAAMVAICWMMWQVLMIKRIAFGLTLTALIFMGVIAILLMVARITLTVLRKRRTSSKRK